MKANNGFSQPSSVLAGEVASGPRRIFSFPGLQALRGEAQYDAQWVERKAAAIRYAWAMIGQPYRWGGDDPIEGFDCSGLVIEILQTVGILPHGKDWTASSLAATLQALGAKVTTDPAPGAVVFYRNAQGHISHVELAIGAGLVIGASGGGQATDDLEDAAAENAFVKLRPYDYRAQARLIIQPFPDPAAAPVTLTRRAKAAAGDIVAIIAAALGLIPGLFKKKPFTLWQWDLRHLRWIDHGTYSARQCKKLRNELVHLGQDPKSFTILRKGAKPPAEGPQ